MFGGGGGGGGGHMISSKKKDKEKQKSPEYQTNLEKTQQLKAEAFQVCKELILKEATLTTEDTKKPGYRSFTNTCLERGLFKEIISILG
jgi:hypothetical protein